jgi:carbamoyl-phosphate synthase small subunit
MTNLSPAAFARPPGSTAVLALSDGSLFWGRGFGAEGVKVGEACFNTAMTGYQETLTDPSYAGQMINFTFPHIGNVGVNDDDVESAAPTALGLIVRAPVTPPANWRARACLQDWLKRSGVVGLCDVDTRRIARLIRDNGAPNAALAHAADGRFDVEDLLERARVWPGLAGMDLASVVSTKTAYDWDEAGWRLGQGYRRQSTPRFHVVAVDFGAKRNILRCLADAGCRVTVVPASASAETILALQPDGVFLSNGPGDPAATGTYAVPVIQRLIESGKPLFGICLGHQMLALALGAKTTKMARGHRGANHPVKDLRTGMVEITSQNHGFVVVEDSLPAHVATTHVSLFDGSNEGIRLKDKPVFSVQYHPEASPGPHDSHYLFQRFVEMMSEVA